MLVEFSVENYKSFKTRSTLNMVAAKITSLDPNLDKDAVIEVSKDLSILRCAAIYGANASGKSNLIAALDFMKQFVIGSSKDTMSGSRIEVQPFRLSKETIEAPSSFEVVLQAGDAQYRYGFEATTASIVAEWLYYAPKSSKKETTLFTRLAQKITVKDKLDPEAEPLKSRTRDNALFLSVLAQFNNAIALDLMAWFNSLMITTGLEDQFREYTLACLQDKSISPHIFGLLDKFDLGFTKLLLPNPTTVANLMESLSGDAKQHFADIISKRIYAVHPVYNENETVDDVELFDLEEHESQGTRKVVALAGLIHFVLNHKGVCVIDELDARLHPLITRAIVQLFNSASSNPHGAQLIFATHDTNLLDKSFLRRDQIWFAEKDKFACTHLVSLVEYRTRNDAAFEKHYLQGRYGAIPFIGDITRLPGATDAE